MGRLVFTKARIFFTFIYFNWTLLTLIDVLISACIIKRDFIKNKRVKYNCLKIMLNRINTTLVRMTGDGTCTVIPEAKGSY